MNKESLGIDIYMNINHDLEVVNNSLLNIIESPLMICSLCYKTFLDEI